MLGFGEYQTRKLEYNHLWITENVPEFSILNLLFSVDTFYKRISPTNVLTSRLQKGVRVKSLG